MEECPGWVARLLEGAPWRPPLCRGGLEVEACAHLGGGVYLVEAVGCGEKVVAALTEGGDAEASPAWVERLLAGPPAPFESHCPSPPAGGVSRVRVVGGSERGFTLQLGSGTGEVLEARVSRRAEFDNIEFAVLDYLSRRGFEWAPRLRCYVLLEGYQYMIVTDAVEGETAARRAVEDAAPSRGPREGFRRVLEGIAGAAAALHSLMSSCGEAWCSPEPVREQDASSWVERIRWRGRAIEALARQAGVPLDSEAVDSFEAAAELAESLADGLYASFKTRIHGDLHLYQVIVGPGGRVYLTDFEGEPYKAPASRLEKETPERDLAALLRSLDYAAALASGGSVDHAVVYSEWLTASARLLLEAYESAAPRLGLELDPDSFREAVAFWLLERASYEAVYEVTAATGLHWIPLAALRRMASGGDPLLRLLVGGGRG